MGDQGMDPCECIWGHEMAMRRLLNLLRSSQSYCNDSECFRDGTTRNQSPDNALLMTLFVVAALFLYMFRPRPQRITEGPSKPNNQGNDSSGAPPTPPPAAT